MEKKAEIDTAKRLYRGIVDTLQKLETISKQKKNAKDMFLPDSVSYRQRLKEFCEKLMFVGRVEYSRKAEEVLWRRCFYETMQAYKQSRKERMEDPSTGGHYRMHLLAATGYYQHLLLRIQMECGVSFNNILDFGFISDARSDDKKSKKHADTRMMEWARKACHRCLIYLGDLARYQAEYDGQRSVCLSQRYYHQALTLCPEIGMPHNQLGTLTGSAYYGCDAAYYYMRCLSVPVPFNGAQKNLQRLLEKNKKKYMDMASRSKDVKSEHQREKDIKSFVLKFLYTLDILLDGNQRVSMMELQQLCTITLEDFNMCMYYSEEQEEEGGGSASAGGRPAHLSNDMVFKMIALCLMIVAQLQKKGSAQLSAAIAFSLALFSHVINHAVNRLQEELYKAENPKLSLEESDGEGSGTHERAGGTEDNESSSRKTHLTKLRKRRRRPGSSSESDLSEGEDFADSDEDFLTESEAEDINLSSDSGSEALSEEAYGDAKRRDEDAGRSLCVRSSENLKQISDQLFASDRAAFNAGRRLSASHDQPDEDSDDSALSDSSSETDARAHRDLTSVLSIVAAHQLLMSVKVFTDWLRFNEPIIDTCAQSSQLLWSRFSILLNLLPHETDFANTDVCGSPAVREEVERLVSQGKEWTQTCLLMEDLALRKCCPLRQAHGGIDFSTKSVARQQQAVLRICALRGFGYRLAAMPSLHFSYDAERRLFLAVADNAEAAQDTQEAQQHMAEVEARRNQLMKDMAQLRLQAEVKKLEGSVRQTVEQRPHLPPYLVADADALCCHLGLVRQMLGSSRFIVIIPMTVIDGLDVLKKESAGAREAIRWLEGEMHRGNKFVRMQRQHEKDAHGHMKNMKKKDKDAWRFYQIVECCRYLSQQSDMEVGPGMVTILRGQTVDDSSTRIQAAAAAAASTGIEVEYVVDFHRKWQDASKVPVKTR